jgi:hypothetical protein
MPKQKATSTSTSTSTSTPTHTGSIPFQSQTIWTKINNGVMNLNASKYFAGICMIVLNIGSKYITIELSKSQEDYVRNSIGRIILLFSIAWIGTRDIYTSLVITVIFQIMTQHIFNEKSRFCILPERTKQLYNAIDTNQDNKISDDELKRAIQILQASVKR